MRVVVRGFREKRAFLIFDVFHFRSTSRSAHAVKNEFPRTTFSPSCSNPPAFASPPSNLRIPHYGERYHGKAWRGDCAKGNQQTSHPFVQVHAVPHREQHDPNVRERVVEAVQQNVVLEMCDEQIVRNAFHVCRQNDRHDDDQKKHAMEHHSITKTICTPFAPLHVGFRDGETYTASASAHKNTDKMPVLTNEFDNVLRSCCTEASSFSCLERIR